MPLVAGVDCSTQSTKVLLIESDDGSVVATGSAPHRVDGVEGARETHPDVWWNALQIGLAQTGRAREVRSIAIAGQQHGLVVLDGAGRPLRPAQLWNDTRAAEDAFHLIDALGGSEVWAERTGLVPVASFTVSKWAWLRRVEPATAAATRHVRLPHDYLNGCLTGQGSTDRGDASGTGWWSSLDESYDDEILALPSLELASELLPSVRKPTELAGEVSLAAATHTGLSHGTLVGPGTGDNMGAALGLGLEPGVPVMSLGTSGTVYMSSETRSADASGTVSGFADATGRFLPLVATLNCTQAVDRLAQWLGLERESIATRSGVVVFPYLDGERTPNLPRASGAIMGLRHTTTSEEILLAGYEGVVLGLIDALDEVAAQSSGIEPDAPLILIGGGSKGSAWRNVVARLSGRPLQIPEAEELVALGAGAQAAAVLTGENPEAVARRWNTRAGKEIEAMERDDAAIELIRRYRSQIEF
jgi:xylulokinase